MLPRYLTSVAQAETYLALQIPLPTVLIKLNPYGLKIERNDLPKRNKQSELLSNCKEGAGFATGGA